MLMVDRLTGQTVVTCEYAAAPLPLTGSFIATHTSKCLRTGWSVAQAAQAAPTVFEWAACRNSATNPAGLELPGRIRLW